MKFMSTVRGPWGPAGTELEIETPTKTQERYIHLGYLERVDEPKDEGDSGEVAANLDKNEDSEAESEGETQETTTKRRRRSS